jgi:hypothetical protein
LGAGSKKKIDDMAAHVQGWMSKLQEEIKSRLPTDDFIII